MTISMLLLEMWMAFNVAYLLDVWLTRYLQQRYLKTTKRWERKEADFPRFSFFYIDKWWHWIIASPAVFVAFLITLTMVLLVSTKEAIKTFGITFMEEWQ